jgi:DNA-binding NtrC family response regulator
MNVLTVFDFYGCHDLVEMVVEQAGGNLVRAHSYDMARTILASDPPRIVICERVLADGCWQDLLENESVKNGATLLIVTSKHADASLWAEVLNLGGYDVLRQPLDEREVMRLFARNGIEL